MAEPKAGRSEGTLVRWNDDRGFGFIAPIPDRPQVFAHISDFPHGGRRPRAGERLSFEIETGRDGRQRAAHISWADGSSERWEPQRPRRPARDDVALSRRWILLLIAVTLAVFGYFQYPRDSRSPQPAETLQPAPSIDAATSSASSDPGHAFENHLDNVQVQGQGIVVKVLPDDDEGSRHQRFLVRLDSGQTILIAHNIDLAPRITALGANDAVEFSGEYEWNPKGGVVHWTHHDPAGRHPAGWLRHDGRDYQ